MLSILNTIILTSILYLSDFLKWLQLLTIVFRQSLFWEYWPLNLGKHAFLPNLNHFQKFAKDTSVTQNTDCQYLQLTTLFWYNFQKKKGRAENKLSSGLYRSWFRPNFQPISLIWLPWSGQSSQVCCNFQRGSKQ